MFQSVYKLGLHSYLLEPEAILFTLLLQHSIYPRCHLACYWRQLEPRETCADKLDTSSRIHPWQKKTEESATQHLEWSHETRMQSMLPNLPTSQNVSRPAIRQGLCSLFIHPPSTRGAIAIWTPAIADGPRATGASGRTSRAAPAASSATPAAGGRRSGTRTSARASPFPARCD